MCKYLSVRDFSDPKSCSLAGSIPLPFSTALVPADTMGSLPQSDQPEITVPTLVPGMITPGSVQESPSGSFPSTKGVHNVTKIDLKAISGRSPEAVEFLSCDSSDALSSDRVSRSDARSPSKRSRTQSPTSRRPTILSVARLFASQFFFHFALGKGSQNWFRKFHDFIFLEHILWKETCKVQHMACFNKVQSNFTLWVEYVATYMSWVLTWTEIRWAICLKPSGMALQAQARQCNLDTVAWTKIDWVLFCNLFEPVLVCLEAFLDMTQWLW